MIMKQSIYVSVCFVLFLALTTAQVPPSDDDWNKAIGRAKAFVANLTLDEKVSLATGVGWANGPCVGNTPSISRMSFPGLCLQDSPTGVRFVDKASAFPAAINVAATWNRSLIYERSQAMGAEFRGKGVNVALTPMMNVARAPAAGRNWEGFGGDSYLQGEGAYFSVLGIQNNGVIACAKHYIANSQEHFRTTQSSNVDERTLQEVYELPFLRAVQAGVGSFMCSYNKVNETYACENGHTINGILKGQFGFRGFLMSDWSATMSGVPSVLAGLDMTMPGDITFGSGTSYFGKNLSNAVNDGAVPSSRVDDMGVRILTPYFLFGQDKNFPAVNFDFRDPNKGTHVDVQADHAKIIRKVGADSNILLKNEGPVLPFKKSSSTGQKQFTYALIGSDAGPSSNGPNGCPDHGCNDGTLAQGWGSGTTNFPYLITPLDAITKAAAGLGQTVVSSLSDEDVNTAKKLAASADITVVFANADSGEDYITVEGNQGDRNDLLLWHNANELVEAAVSVSNQVVVVLHVVGPVEMPWINEPNVKAVVLAGLPGQESGNSLVDVLFGAVNPSGKLPYTIGVKRTDYPADVVYDGGNLSVDYTEGLYVDYKWFDLKNIEPYFPFGYGLSYTTFAYSNLRFVAVDADVVAAEKDVFRLKQNNQFETLRYKVSVAVNNTGGIDGEEVVQLYLSFPAVANEPVKVLRGFDKVFVASSSTAEASIYLTDLEISYFNVANNKWEIAPGEYQVLVGASSTDIRLRTTFTEK